MVLVPFSKNKSMCRKRQMLACITASFSPVTLISDKEENCPVGFTFQNFTTRDDVWS